MNRHQYCYDEQKNLFCSAMYIDSRCHLERIDLKSFSNDFSRFVTLAMEAGVTHMLSVGGNLKDCAKVLKLVESFDNISVAAGVHPATPVRLDLSEFELIQACDHPKVIAIGETGLDYSKNVEITVQRERFKTHIRTAKRMNKPLLVYNREAMDEVLRILREEGAGAVGGVFHGQVQDWASAKKLLDMNFKVSFSGALTYRIATDIREVAARVPDDALLLGTDTPYSSPESHRGKPSHPAMIGLIAECLAALRGTSVEHVAAASTENFMNLFRQG